MRNNKCSQVESWLNYHSVLLYDISRLVNKDIRVQRSLYNRIFDQKQV